MPKIRRFKKAIEKLDIIYLDEKEQLIYEGEQKAIRDEQEKMRTAEEKGVAKGIEAGIEKGKIAIAQNMKDEGLSNDLIMKMTGLSLDNLKELI